MTCMEALESRFAEIACKIGCMEISCSGTGGFVNLDSSRVQLVLEYQGRTRYRVLSSVTK
jgi:hypothetical protein